MIDNSKTETAAAPKRAGNSLKDPTLGLAQAWLAFCADPQRKESESALAIELDALFKKCLPDGSCQGVIQGREPDVRQEAYLLLIGRYLAGNQLLMAATEIGDRNLVESQIKRSLAGALRSVSRGIINAAKRHLELHAYGEDIDGCPLAACMHPACTTSHWQLPHELQRKMVFAALRMGVDSRLFSAANAGIAIEMTEADRTQTEVAQVLGISRQAVHARLSAVRKHLQALIDKQEFPTT